MSCTAIKRALLIGIDYSGTKNNLNGCVNDCEHIDCLLTCKLGYKIDNIVFLNDSDPNNRDKMPTRENILRELKTKIRETQKGDILFFFFSGHGNRCKDVKRIDKHGYEQGIVPLDMKIIMDEELRDLFSKLHQDCTIFIMTDSCFSGNIIDLRYKLDIKKIKKNGRELIQTTLETDEFYPETPFTIMHLAGCKENQTSADAFEDGEDQGMLSWGFLKVMKQYNNQPTLV
jgi:hypothetical protein